MTTTRVDYRTLPVGTEYRDPCNNVMVKQSTGTDNQYGPYMVTPTGRHSVYGIAAPASIITERTLR
jgi:hypothetical protein